MKYAHVVHYVRHAIWAIDPDKMHDLLAVLAFRAGGGVFTPEELQARLGTVAEGSAEPSTSGTLAIVPLRGVIAHRIGLMDDSSGGASAERFTSLIGRVAADPAVSTILIDADTPGGTVPGVIEAADAVFAARETKRVVAIANSKMQSAGYWIGSQAHEVIAIPSALDPSIGSIGAFTVHQDLSAALEQAGVKTTVISAGKHKVDGNPFEPLSEDYRAHLQAAVDAAYAAFVKAVARGRGVSVSDVRRGFGEGRSLSAVDAKAAGLIDRIATMDDTMARLSGQGRARGAGGVRAAADDDAGCPACGGSGLQPEQHMGDLNGQAPCPACRPVQSSAVSTAKEQGDRVRRLKIG